MHRLPSEVSKPAASDRVVEQESPIVVIFSYKPVEVH